MKKLATLIALIGLAGGAQAATQTATGGAFEFSYDDSVLQLSSAGGYDSVNIISVWDNATSQFYAANFRTYSGYISFTESSDLLASASTPSASTFYATLLGISSTANLNIHQSSYYGPSEGFMETGIGVASTSLVGGFSGQGTSNFGDYAQTTRNETFNMAGIGRAGNFDTYADIYSQCSPQGCTIADYTRGLETTLLSLNITETVSASADSFDIAAYQRRGYSQVSVYAYEFAGYAGTPPVPEPDTYAMLLAGIGLMGSIARRRKQAGQGVGRR